MTLRSAIVVGNPKPKSRTYDAAAHVCERLCGAPPDVALDLIDLGGRLIGFGDPDVSAAVESVRGCDVVVFASPTYKATYTGLLKLFLDQFAAGSLNGSLGFAVMLGGGPAHALAPELLLKPVLVEIGAACPVRGLYLLDSNFTSEETIGPWVEQARPFIDFYRGRKTA